jgi:hypothetical protein
MNVSDAAVAGAGFSAPADAPAGRPQQDVCALWAEIFERAAPMRSASGAGSAIPTARIEAPSAPSAATQAVDRTDPEWPADTPDIARAAMTGPGPSPEGFAARPRLMADPSAAAGSAIWPGEPVRTALRPPSADPRPTALPSRPAAAVATTPEAVGVSVEGDAVWIVARDAGLAPPAALRAGFEAAQRLTGRRGALQELVLNGHLLYRQPTTST